MFTCNGGSEGRDFVDHGFGGFLQPSVFHGRLFISAATSLSHVSLKSLRSMALQELAQQAIGVLVAVASAGRVWVVLYPQVQWCRALNCTALIW